jgi:ABC-type uncharacterized transport system permease subunit
MDCIYYAVNLGFFEVILHHTQTLGALTATQTRVFVACFLFMDGIYMTFFSASLWFFPESINKGSFDYTLTRPASSFFLTVFRDFSLGSFINFLMAVGILTHALTRLSPAPGALDLVFLFALLLAGAASLLALRLLFILPAFWVTEVSALRELSWTLNTIGERPSGIYPKAFRVVFTFIFPILAAVALPAEAFLGGWKAEPTLTVLGVCAGLWFVVLKVWAAGTRVYSSASS